MRSTGWLALASLLATGCLGDLYLVNPRELAEARANATTHHPVPVSAIRAGDRANVFIRSNAIVAEAPPVDGWVRVRTRAVDATALSGLGAIVLGGAMVAIGAALFQRDTFTCSDPMQIICPGAYADSGGALIGVGLFSIIGGIIAALVGQTQHPAEVPPGN